MGNLAQFSDLLGKTLIEIEKTDNTITFFTSEGEEYQQYHNQDCCESVSVEDVAGELDDLLYSPILQAEESSKDDPNPSDGVGSWTFYKLATVHGYVTIRWYGSSNGYYSTAVSFTQLSQSSDLKQRKVMSTSMPDRQRTEVPLFSWAEYHPTTELLEFIEEARLRVSNEGLTDFKIEIKTSDYDEDHYLRGIAFRIESDEEYEKRVKTQLEQMKRQLDYHETIARSLREKLRK